MAACLSGKCTVLINFSVAPQMRHSRLELPSISPIFSALNISIGHPRVLIPEFREKVAIVKLAKGTTPKIVKGPSIQAPLNGNEITRSSKLGHSQIQLRTLGLNTDSTGLHSQGSGNGTPCLSGILKPVENCKVGFCRGWPTFHLVQILDRQGRANAALFVSDTRYGELGHPALPAGRAKWGDVGGYHRPLKWAKEPYIQPGRY
jgi:hypothetical protein